MVARLDDVVQAADEVGDAARDEREAARPALDVEAVEVILARPREAPRELLLVLGRGC